MTLRKLRKGFDLGLLERRLQESVPLKALNFAVVLNGKRLAPRYVPGRRFPFLEGCPHGVINGEIILRPSAEVAPEETGIQIKVKQVTISRDLFGAETWGVQGLRLSGEVNADFLPLTSDRTGFITDSAEYHGFCEVMAKVLERIRQELQGTDDKRENRRVSRALKEVVQKLEQALLKNADWCPPGLLPVGEGEGHEASVAGAAGSSGQGAASEKAAATSATARKTSKRRPKIKPLTGSALIKKLKLGQMGLGLIMDHFGPDAPEAFTQAEIIHINRDHPLYQREAFQRERHIMHIARLLSQEVAMMSLPKNPRLAFERQSKLLRDAFVRDAE